MLHLTLMIILILILLGLCFGSFVNALIWRLHWQMQHSNKKKGLYSIVSGRSICMSCGHELSSLELIPVISWVVLRGRCQKCHKKYPDTPLSELLTPFLFVVSYLYWPYNFNALGVSLFVFWLFFVVGFIALALYDIKWYTLPNKIILSLTIVWLIQLVLLMSLFNFTLIDLLSTLASIFVGGGIFYILYQISDGKWIGGGDVKLGLLLGAIIGNPLHSVLLIFLASLLGTMFSLPMLVFKKLTYKGHLPFGPFLLLAAFIVQLFGANIVAGYQRLIGL